MSQKRRRATLTERLTPCACCGYPVSQRHHLAEWHLAGGEHEHTIQLCANCHEAVHLLITSMRELRAEKKNTAAQRMFLTIRDYLGGGEDPRVQFLASLLKARDEAFLAGDLPAPDTTALLSAVFRGLK